jgi:hypothetical protein
VSIPAPSRRYKAPAPITEQYIAGFLSPEIGDDGSQVAVALEGMWHVFLPWDDLEAMYIAKLWQSEEAFKFTMFHFYHRVSKSRI